MLEQALRNAAGSPQMSYGNNYAVVNNMLAAIGAIHNLQGVLQGDNMNDAYLMNLRSKVQELENVISMFGQQRLMACGINVGAPGAGQPMGPLMANQPMYNQQVYYPNAQQPQGFGAPPPPPPPPAPPPPPPGYGQQPQQPAYAAPPPAYATPTAPPPPPPPPPAPAAPPPPPQAAPPPPPPPPPAPPASSSSSGGGSAIGMSLPGMGGGGDDKAAGRDFLLKLLAEK